MLLLEFGNDKKCFKKLNINFSFLYQYNNKIILKTNILIYTFNLKYILVIYKI
jgi:hypothetical protein